MSDTSHDNGVRDPERTGGGQALKLPRGPAMFLAFPEDVRVAGGGGPNDPPADPTDPTFDERVLSLVARKAPLWDDDMVEDIAVNGVRVPVTVVRDDDKEPRVNAGRRRILHARAANERRVSRGQEKLRVKLIVEKGDAKTLFLMARRENAFRVQDETIQRARNAERAIQQFNALPEEVASSEGVSAKTVREWLKLLELAPEVQQAIDLGRIKSTAAIAAFKDVPRKEQAAKLREMIASGDTTVAGVTAKAKADKKKKEAEAKGENPAEVDTGEKPPTRSVLKKLLVHVTDAQARGEKLPLLADDTSSETLIEYIMKAAKKGPLDPLALAEQVQHYGVTVMRQTVEWHLGDRNRKGIKGLMRVLRDAGVKD